MKKTIIFFIMCWTTFVHTKSTGEYVTQILSIKENLSTLSNIMFSENLPYLSKSDNVGRFSEIIPSLPELEKLVSSDTLITEEEFMKISQKIKDEVTKRLEAEHPRDNVHFTPLFYHAFSLLTKIKVKDINDKKLVKATIFKTLKGHKGSVTSVTFSSNCQNIATASKDHTAKIWDAKTGKVIQTLKGHGRTVLSVAFSPNDEMVATGSLDHTAKIWDAKTGDLIHTLKGHLHKVSTVAFSPDGNEVVTGSDDTTVKIWSAISGEELFTFKEHHFKIFSVAFAPDGNIVSASMGGDVLLWEKKTGKVIITKKATRFDFLNAAVAPDQTKVVAITGLFGDARIWDVISGKEIIRLTRKSEGFFDNTSYESVAFCSDGMQVATGSASKKALIWNLKYEDIRVVDPLDRW